MALLRSGVPLSLLLDLVLGPRSDDLLSQERRDRYCSVVGRSAEVGTDWQQQLRSRGYRLTPQRQLVLEAVGALGHGTPEAVAAAVQERASGVNISTVYRTLDLLEQIGLVRHTHLGHGAPTYSVASDHEHVHLKCRDCGRVEEADPELFGPTVEALMTQRGFAVDLGHFAVFGRCRECAASQDG